METPTTTPGAPPPLGPGGPVQPTHPEFSGLAREVGAEHGAGVSEPPKRGQGKRGPDKAPRKRRDPVPAVDGGEAGPGDAPAVAGGPEPVAGPPPVVLPPDLVEEIGREAADVLDQFRKGRVTKAAVECGIDEKLAQPVIDSVGMTPQRKAIIGRLVPLVAQEWGASSMVSPTAALGLLVATGELAVSRAIAAFKAEAARRNPPPAPPSPAPGA